MPLQTINNGDSGAVARAKINAAIEAINAMSTSTTTSTSTTMPTTTSSTSTSTSSTTQPTTTSSTTTFPTTTSSTTSPTIYNYQINNCAGGGSYTVSSYTPLSLAAVYKLYAVDAPFDINACWSLTTSVMGGTFVTSLFSYNTCIDCTSGTTSTSTTTFPTTTSSTTMYIPPSTTSSTTMYMPPETTSTTTVPTSTTTFNI